MAKLLDSSFELLEQRKELLRDLLKISNKEAIAVSLNVANQISVGATVLAVLPDKDIETMA